MKKINKMLRIIFMLGLFLTYQSSAAISPYIGFDTGDSFEFEFSQFDIYRKTNQTIVIDEDGSELVNNTIKVTINEIEEANDGFFEELYGESTYINITDTFKGGIFDTIVPLDYWFFYYYQMEIMFDTFITFFDPELGFFGEIGIPDTEDFSNFAGLPVLATTNTTFYQALEEEIPDYSGTPPMPPDRIRDDQEGEIMLSNRLTEASLRDKFFKMNVTNADIFTGETTSNETWHIGGISNFYVEINTQQGVVDKISWYFIYAVIIGLETDIFSYEVQISNLNPGITARIDLELIQGLILVLAGLMIIKWSRKKK
ncbi:hypothetical protein EU534_02640 [Candidatus Heimdallarchaeota archaeon]|nr:MAG: hypothetical protein EU534_02640 [Candidatus Heimdallarchaeota archaeon]